ncbi:response regulator transcription factor [Candidatus Gracilibacteria bacterium]|nr:response regulator transcription factor [Candidatus Gracilibacteria bacterium]
MKIALIEDNKLLGENTKLFLQLKNIEVEIYECVEDFDENDLQNYDILVLDINLPGKNGDIFLTELRQKGYQIPIMMLTSKNTCNDIVDGLEKGADDYISKPFNYEEFTARLKVLARRKIGEIPTNIRKYQIENDEYEVNFDAKSLKKNGQNIYLGSLEFKLFDYFIKNRGKVLDRASIYEEVWGEFESYQLSRTVDVYVGYLRKKFGKNVIKTRKGDGYILE